MPYPPGTLIYEVLHPLFSPTYCRYVSQNILRLLTLHNRYCQVNISVPKDKAAEYIEWLREFTEMQVKRIDEKKFWLTEERNNKDYFTIHYVIDSEQHLHEYTAKYQQEIAHAEETRFNFLVISRRILKMLL
ncbi:hypothetical protein BC937DRAFT_89588 [Endogone sp. FLAS-F59071]|nr:hypothetical protein BC937DRAFT_89588 [Endogone sp. FLAS-F59071]|eukprot:RUS17709.1 hypothetical protein BC937DRAFT_89588 [Endogone sp. FLAS-F59071]